MEFFSSDIAVAIAWICGIAGFIYGLMQKQSNNNLKIELRNCQNLVQSMQNSMNTVENEASRNEVHQAGTKNVYTKRNSGGMIIKM